MKPDYLFLVPGLLVLCVALWRLVSRSRLRVRLLGLAWLCLAAGLLLQSVSPRLKVENKAVVLTETEHAVTGFSYERYLNRVRAFQLASTLLIFCGALSLAIGYRGALRDGRKGGEKPVNQTP
jgi:hypothetical protein